MSQQLEFDIDESQLPERLDVLVTRLLAESPSFLDLTRSQVQKLIKAGGVALDGKQLSKPGVQVHELGSLRIDFSAIDTSVELKPFDFSLDVVYEDESLVVVNKPAGLVVHPGAGNREETLLNALVHRYQGFVDGFSKTDDSGRAVLPERIGIVHRLDKDTSGLMVVARNQQALSSLSQQFQSRSAKRSYFAAIETTPRRSGYFESEEEGTIDLPIGRDPKNRLRMAVREDGKNAVSHWTRLKRLPYALLLEFKLETGRTHQIRVHAAAKGSPILGDSYRVDECLPYEVESLCKALGRQALHAKSLEFEHPVSSKRLEFETELPGDLQQFVASLSAQADGGEEQ